MYSARFWRQRAPRTRARASARAVGLPKKVGTTVKVSRGRVRVRAHARRVALKNKCGMRVCSSCSIVQPCACAGLHSCCWKERRRGGEGGSDGDATARTQRHCRHRRRRHPHRASQHFGQAAGLCHSMRIKKCWCQGESRCKSLGRAYSALLGGGCDVRVCTPNMCARHIVSACVSRGKARVGLG